jgi:hypothetical protein
VQRRHESASSLFLINPLGAVVEMTRRSQKSRSSAKIRNHAPKG